MLNNRFYIGELRPNGTVYKGSYRLLIDPALFEKCQDILKGKNRRTGNPELLFSGGIFRCAHCGSAMAGEQIKRKLKGGGHNIHVYYKCGNNNPEPDHPRVRWKEEDIEKVILDWFDGMKLPSKETEETGKPRINTPTPPMRLAYSGPRSLWGFRVCKSLNR